MRYLSTLGLMVITLCSLISNARDDAQRLARLYPEADFAEQALDKLGKNLTEHKLLAEAAYMAHPSRAGFERPYGLAWLLALAQELDEWDHPQANEWREWLRPAEAIAVQRLHDWVPKLHYPVRAGEHSQTAFALVTDREDGKLAHIDGLNISRAWMLEGIAAGLPEGDSRREPLLQAARAHAEDGLSGVSDEHYAGSHWLASFAIYLQTRRGINRQ